MRTFGPNQGLLEGRVLSIGAVKGLTILVNFQDVTQHRDARRRRRPCSTAPTTPRNGNICSAREYFRRVSSGKLDYTNVVVGPFTLSRNRQFYVNNLLVEEALAARRRRRPRPHAVRLARRGHHRRPERPLRRADAVSTASSGRTTTTSTCSSAPCAPTSICSPASGARAADLSIGTFCHENGHLLCRFPDMYDYGERDGDRRASAGIGNYCLMGSGNHLDFGRSPSPVCAYLRDLAGWCDNEIDLSVAGAYEAKHGDYNTVMKYRTSKPNEYFLVENRIEDGPRPGAARRAASPSTTATSSARTSSSRGRRRSTTSARCSRPTAHRDLELNANQGDGSRPVRRRRPASRCRPSRRRTRASGTAATRAGRVGHLQSRRRDHVRASGSRRSWRRRPGEAQPMLAIPDNRTRRRRQRDPDRRRPASSARIKVVDRHRASLHRRPACRAAFTDRAARDAARADRRQRRQRCRDLRVDAIRRVEPDDRAADAGRLDVAGVGSSFAGYRHAAELEAGAQLEPRGRERRPRGRWLTRPCGGGCAGRRRRRRLRAQPVLQSFVLTRV